MNLGKKITGQKLTRKNIHIYILFIVKYLFNVGLPCYLSMDIIRLFIQNIISLLYIKYNLLRGYPTTSISGNLPEIL